MIDHAVLAVLDNKTLLHIIGIQNEVVQEGLEFERIAFLVAKRSACRKVGLRSMIVVPLVFKDRAIGALKVISKEVDGFNERHAAILNILSTLVSASLYTAEKYGKDELYLNATTDLMTGLKNRSYFYDWLRSHFDASQEAREVFGLFIIDMNNLKGINDAHGHRTGDAAIVEMVERARRALRDSDIFCRLGGDEFGIIIPNVKSPDDMDGLMGRLLESINTSYSVNEAILDLGISIGYSLFSQDTCDIQELIESADKRMYEDKRKRKLSVQ